MGYNDLGNDDQLKLEVPDIGQEKWGVRFIRNFVNRIITHDHTGVNGTGVKLTASSFDSNAISGTSFRLGIDEWLRQSVTSLTEANLFRFSNGRIENGEDIEVTQTDTSNSVAITDGFITYKLVCDSGTHVGNCLVSSGEGSISYQGDTLNVSCTAGVLSSTESNALFTVLKVNL